MVTLLLSSLLLGKQSIFSGTVLRASGKPASEAIVILDGAVKSSPMRKVVIDQRDRKFIPHVSVVTVGTKVDFPNNDVVFHNVFTEYHSERFDFGMYPRGKSKHQVFDRPGLAVLLCSIHPEMSAYVMCVDTPYYAITDRKGSFRIDNVPAGSYRARIWHESGEKFEQDQKLPSAGNVEFRIQR